MHRFEGILGVGASAEKGQFSCWVDLPFSRIQYLEDLLNAWYSSTKVQVISGTRGHMYNYYGHHRKFPISFISARHIWALLLSYAMSTI